MATHDYVIANNSGAAVRQDINNALAAIVSNNSSATEPATTYAFQFWFDTSNNILKFRNAANSAWIDWITTTGRILAPDGAADAPGIGFASDTNTGLWLSGGNDVNVTCNGTTRATFGTTEVNINPILNSGQDFKVGASGESEMFFVDAGNARIGIANGSPDSLVHVRGAEPHIIIQNETQEDTDGGRETRIFFRGEQSGGEWSYLGMIEASHDGTADDQKGKITLSTKDGNDDNSPSETAILDGDGRFTIGGSPAESNAKSLNVVSTSTAVVALARDDSTITEGNDIGAIRFYNNDGGAHQMCAEILAEADGTFAHSDKPTSLVFRAASDGQGNATTKMVLDSEARLIVGHDDNVQNQSLQVFDGAGLCAGFFKHANNNDGPEMTFNSSRNTTFGSHTIVDNDDYLGRIFFRGSDGNSFERGAEICCRVDGTPGDGDMPSRLQFLTAPDGSTTPTERLTIDNAGRVLIGTTTNFNRGNLQVVDNGGGELLLARNDTAVAAGEDIGHIFFSSNDSDTGVETCASITCLAAVDHGADSSPTHLTFSTTPTSSNTAQERMRIHNSGEVTFGTTNTNMTDATTGGGCVLSAGGIDAAADNQVVANFNRTNGDDNFVVTIRHDGTFEGGIKVDGSTVSYEGGHLSRFSQLTGNGDRVEILRGSVLSNLDEMCVWSHEAVPDVLYTAEDELPEGVQVGDVKTPGRAAYTELNEQLNRLKVSDVEGDPNVAGVFQSWDNDDEVFTKDFSCAMTGDFVIRIAQGTTVARGDLLMSAGDGTAKPQDDDIVRSKTIAKVTSTVVSTTYADGSYCVPCVLMAC